MKSIKSKLFTLIALSGIAGQALAENYQYEGFVGISDGDAEASGIGSADTEAFNLGFIANFSEVDTSNGPLAEASFLDRASNFSLSYTDGELGDADSSDLTASLRLVDKESGLTGELVISDGEAADADTEALGLAIGYYVSENTEISLAYADVEVEDADSDSKLLGVKHVTTGATPISIEAALGVAGDDDDTFISLEAIVYPTSELGLGASYSTVDSDVDNDSFSIFADWFMTPVAAVTLSYEDSEVGILETDAINLTFRGRF